MVAWQDKDITIVILCLQLIVEYVGFHMEWHNIPNYSVRYKVVNYRVNLSTNSGVISSCCHLLIFASAMKLAVILKLVINL